MRSISIILPVYNGSKYLSLLNQSIRNQVYKGNIEVITPVSHSIDNSFQICKQLFDIVYEVKEFNHAKTRHEAALKSSGEILVFITQDILPDNEYWLDNLVSVLNDNIVATYSRQIAYKDSTDSEKAMREFNYPEYERLCNISTIDSWGRKNIYYSDSSSATLRNFYFEVNGYNFETSTNEDVIYASRVLSYGKSILYNPKSIVRHSHDFKFIEVFLRYKLIGQFEAENKGILEAYNTNSEGIKLVKYVLRSLLEKKKYGEIVHFLLIQCPVKLISYKVAYYKTIQKQKGNK